MWGFTTRICAVGNVECFYLDGYEYIIMEYCEGGTLFQYIRKNGVVPEHTFVDFVRQIASGLYCLSFIGL
jgi:serine/threonine protein kinase